jgi:hypothetical protein
MRWTFWLVGRQLQAVMVAVFLTVALGFLAMLPFGSAPVMAQEYIRDKEPVPESVDQVTSPIELAFKERPKIPRFFPWLKEQLKDTPAFFRDTKLDLNIRSYYFYRDNYPGSSPQINEAWALGGLSRTGLAGFSITSAWDLFSIRPSRSTRRTTRTELGSSCRANRAIRWSDRSSEG